MTVKELNRDQKTELYQFWLMDLVNENRITWKTMCNRLYDEIEKHEKILNRVFESYEFSNDDFFCSVEFWGGTKNERVKTNWKREKIL